MQPLSVKPGCDPAIAGAGFKAWQIDRDEPVLYSIRGNPWWFEEADKGVWRRVPEGADEMMLARR